MNKGKQSLDRGKNFEYRIVYKARDAGLEAERVGRSGAGDEKREGLKQRIADARNYLLLLAACIEEEIRKEEHNG